MKQSTKSLNIFDEQLVAELAKDALPARPPNYGITATEWAREKGVNYVNARHDLLSRGLKRTMMRDHRNRPVLVYHK